jgi:polyhydroxyalkanoate synthesis regulator phasin
MEDLRVRVEESKEEIKKQIEERVEEVLKKMNLARSSELDELKRQIKELQDAHAGKEEHNPVE